jgi:hypothetical protein
VRPRLARLAALFRQLTGATQSADDTRAPAATSPATEEQRSAEEVKRRLDETRERLKRERPPEDPGD